MIKFNKAIVGHFLPFLDIYAILMRVNITVLYTVQFHEFFHNKPKFVTLQFVAIFSQFVPFFAIPAILLREQQQAEKRNR